jgi:hypothetical protein
MHHFATPDRVAPTDIAGVAAPATVGHVGPVGVVGEQLVAPSVPAQDVPVSVEGVGVDDIAPIEALYAVVLEIAYPLEERVVIVGALTGEVLTAYLVDGPPPLQRSSRRPASPPLPSSPACASSLSFRRDLI